MGRLAGISANEAIRKLRRVGFIFERAILHQARLSIDEFLEL